MPLPVLAAAGIMGAIKGLGSLFGHHQKEKEAEQKYQERMGHFNDWVQGDRTRRSLISGLAKAHGVEGLLPPGTLDSFTNAHYSAPTKEYVPSAMGSFASSALGGGMDYLSTPGNIKDMIHSNVGAGMGGAPSADPFTSEGSFGPSAVGADLAHPLGETGFGSSEPYKPFEFTQSKF